MSYTHRGLSDVVTTVLIILLVVVAVVAIGAYVRTSVDQTGRTVERESICLSNTVSVSSCKYALVSGVATSTLNLKRTSDDVAVSSAGNLQAAIKSTTGTLSTVAVVGTAPTANGALATGTAATANGVVPAEVTLMTEFTLKNGNKITCSSTPVPCAA